MFFVVPVVVGFVFLCVCVWKFQHYLQVYWQNYNYFTFMPVLCVVMCTLFPNTMIEFLSYFFLVTLGRDLMISLVHLDIPLLALQVFKKFFAQSLFAFSLFL